MAPQMLSNAGVKALQPRSKRYSVSDEKVHGLELRVSPKGRKTWSAVMRLPGAKNVSRIKLGYFPDMSLRSARKKCALVLRDVQGGLNPVDERKRKQRGDQTVEGAIAAFLADKSDLKSHAEYRRVLSRYLPQDLKRRSIRSIGRRDVRELMEIVHSGKMTERSSANAKGRKVQANRVRSILSSMFRYSVEMEWLDSNPCQYVRPYKEVSRDRVLTMDEIHKWWTKLDECPMSPTVSNALRLMLITGQRSSDLLRAEWVDISWPDSLWIIPAEKTKNQKPNKVPLSQFAALIMGYQQHSARASPYLFPSPRSTKEPIGITALSRASNRAQDIIGIAHWTPHDLRRTAVTWISELGAPGDIIRKILNHAETTVTDRYDRAEKLDQKFEWLQKWSVKLDEIVRGER